MPRDIKKITPEVIYTLDSLWKLQRLVIDTLDFRAVVEKVVENILDELKDFNLGYKFVALGLVDEKEQALKFVSCAKIISSPQTILQNYSIPLEAQTNICIKCIQRNTPDFTYKLENIFNIDHQQANIIKQANDAQKEFDVKSALLYPLSVRNKTVGIMIFGLGKDLSQVSDLEKSLLQYFTNIVALAVQNSQLYTNLEAETKQLVETNIRLRHLDKLKDEFISVTSHELRTPMTVIKSYLWLLDNDKGGVVNEKQRAYIQKAITGTERMLKLINDMLDVSKIEQMGEKVTVMPVVIREVVEDVVEDIEIKVKEKKLSLNVRLSPDVFKVMSNPQKLREVLMNLISNSLKFTNFGSITLSVKPFNDKFVLFEVIDTGRGIEEEYLDKLFNKFGRTDNSYRTVAEAGGSGLGLYIVKKLVEAMGGEVGAKSEGLGHGSTFWFTLPKV